MNRTLPPATKGHIVRHAPNGREYVEVFTVSNRHHLDAFELFHEHGPKAIAMFGRVGYQFVVAGDREASGGHPALSPTATGPNNGGAL